MLNKTSNFSSFISDLLHVKDRDIDQLSGGELQRFACAMVCIQKADMWVLNSVLFKHFP